METPKTARLVWIDCARFLAMLGVIVCHAGNEMPLPDPLKRACYSAMVVFLLLAGCTGYLSCKKHETAPYWQGVKGRVLSLVLAYALAVLVLQFVKTRRIDLTEYLPALLSFSYAQEHYFIPMFLEIVLVSPFLYRALSAAGASRRPLLWKLALLILAFLLSVFCQRSTLAFPDVYGAGKLLFGGTYLFCYFLGMTLMSSGMPLRSARAKRVGLCVSLGAFLALLVIYCRYDLSLEPAAFLGVEGFSPPGLLMLSLGIASFFFLYCGFSLLGDTARGARLCRPVAWCGKRTLYIYLYHILVLSLLYPRVRGLLPPWLAVPVVIAAMAAVPLLAKAAWDRLLSFRKRK